VGKDDHHIVSFPPVNRDARKAAFNARRAEKSGSVFVKIPTGRLSLKMANTTILVKGPQDPDLGAVPPITRSPTLVLFRL
jgi:hypothetical protein